MYENGKMRHVETIPGIEGEGTKKNGSYNISTTLYYKNFCKCHNVHSV
jgi:hypothetical protein